MKNIIWKPEGLENLKTSKIHNAVFYLYLRNLHIGTLSVNKGEWSFEYTKLCKKNERYIPLINFPSKSKKYTDNQLWPFFATRIPTSSQNKVKQAVAKSGINENDEIEMLRMFGKYSINNPYVLEAVAG